MTAKSQAPPHGFLCVCNLLDYPATCGHGSSRAVLFYMIFPDFHHRATLFPDPRRPVVIVGLSPPSPPNMVPCKSPCSSKASPIYSSIAYGNTTAFRMRPPPTEDNSSPPSSRSRTPSANACRSRHVCHPKPMAKLRDSTPRWRSTSASMSIAVRTIWWSGYRFVNSRPTTPSWKHPFFANFGRDLRSG